MKINLNAPLSAKKETLINAPLDNVWAVLADLEKWPEWQPDIAFVHLDGSLTAGSQFHWKAAGLNIHSTLQEVAPPNCIGWTGVSLGMSAIHLWTLEAADGGTRVATEESLDGWFPGVLKFFDRAFLDKSLTASLQKLKTRAENGAKVG